MSKLGIYEVHPIADEFPLIDGDEFDALVADIAESGLENPIVLTADGKTLVDGRNRYRACDRLNVEPRYERLPADFTEQQIVQKIISLNMRRRDLNPGQKAVLALSVEKHLAALAKERQLAGLKQNQNSETVVAELPQRLTSRGQAAIAAAQIEPELRKSREQAAKVVGASGRAVSQAKAVERDAPDLLDKVRQGEMALDAADKERKRREAAKPKISDPAPKPSRTMLTLLTHDGQPVQYPQPQSAATFNETPGDGISWASWSWNPVTGCLHGCDYCYARDIATSRRFADAYPAGFTPLFHHERLDAPANTTIPAKHADDPAYKRVFVCSMADLYGRWVPDEWIEKVHASMLRSPQWQYILLTKFPSRYVGLDLPEGAWVGTSVDEQKRVRIAQDAFAKLPDNVIKWLSLEPLREPLEFDDLSMFDWVVIGAQTATTQPDGFLPAFAPEFDWVVDIYQKAREAGCKVHFKPNIMDGKPGMRFPDEYPGGC